MRLSMRIRYPMHRSRRFATVLVATHLPRCVNRIHYSRAQATTTHHS
uniref:Uncharacterized protein n=1 Tax=Arundo donax TaxID=35708 RepID=A0A0A9GQQ0_ARUDO